ncbi:MAG: hypothetical protein GXO87_07595 [Chlorobi bacterium]|nr:hypothetical protein [Chlorobiota bacterium]
MKTSASVLLLFSLFLFLSGCSSNDNNSLEPQPEPQNESIPDPVLPELNVPATLTAQADLGNFAAIQAQSSLETLEGIQGYYGGILPPGKNLNNIFSKTNVDSSGKIYEWQIGDLKVTLEYTNWGGTIMELSEYWDGDDGSGMHYDHFLKADFTAGLTEFAGALRLYELGNSEPIMEFLWKVDEFLGKMFTFKFLNMLDIKYVYSMPGTDYSTLGYEDGTSKWMFDLHPDGTCDWTQFDLDGNAIDSGSW